MLTAMLVKGTIKNAKEIVSASNNGNKKVVPKYCATFTTGIKRKNNTQIVDFQYIDVVIPMYDLIENNDYHSKTSGILSPFCRDEVVVNRNSENVDFTEANATTNLFNLKVKLTSQIRNKMFK